MKKLTKILALVLGGTLSASLVYGVTTQTFINPIPDANISSAGTWNAKITTTSLSALAPIFYNNVTGVFSLGISAVSSSRAINTTAPLFGGGDLSADRTISLGIDAVSSTRAINTGFGLTGGGNLSADRTLYFTGAFATSGEANIRIASSGAVWTFSQPTSSASISGFLSSADWSTFNSKQNNISFPIPVASTSLIAGTNITLNTNTLDVDDVFPLKSNNLSDLNSTSTARTNLGLVIGTNVQAWDAGLDDIAGLAVTDSNFIVGNGTNWVAETGATARTSLGLADTSILASSTWLKVANNLSDLNSSSTARNNLLGTGTGLQYFSGDGTFKTPSTTNITEGTNLYFTDVRARAVWNQDLYSTSSPAFSGVTSTKISFTNASGTGLGLSSFTASRLLSSDAGKNLASVSNLTSWIAGTANETEVTDDGDGTVTVGIVNNPHFSNGLTASGTSIFDTLKAGEILVTLATSGLDVADLTVSATTTLSYLKNGFLKVNGSGVVSTATIGIADTTGIQNTISFPLAVASTSLTGGAGLTLTTNDMACDTADASTFGCLTAANWTTFNNKAGTSTFSATAPIFYNANTATFSLGISAVSSSRAINTTGGIQGGGDLSADRTLSLGFTIVSSSRAVNAGFGLTGGGDLSADRTLYFTGKFATSGLSGLQISSSGAIWEFSQSTSSASSPGFLSSADWTTFNDKEPAITGGTTAQYWRGDKSFQTLNQAAVAGLTTASAPTFTSTTLSNFTAGSIPFFTTGGALTQDNTNLFWDNTNARLGVGIATPKDVLHIKKSTNVGLAVGGAVSLTNAVSLSAVNDAATANIPLEIRGSETMFSIGNVAIGNIARTYPLNVNGVIYSPSHAYFLGNLGVGTVSPGEKLHVEGTVYSSSTSNAEGFKCSGKTNGMVVNNATTSINVGGVGGGMAIITLYDGGAGTNSNTDIFTFMERVLNPNALYTRIGGGIGGGGITATSSGNVITFISPVVGTNHRIIACVYNVVD